MPKRQGRHTPAFLLLFLADGPAYGALLLTKMQTELPYCFSDSAGVYRSLQEMEKENLVEFHWETPDSGQPRKWYTITAKGRIVLEKYAEDIRQRRACFDFFLRRHENVSTGFNIGKERRK
jgi:DNA-binding PadR family transcriptional regulator